MTIKHLEQKLKRRPHSPLFARLAGEYLRTGRFQEARDLCLAGIERHPSYSTGHLTIARNLADDREYATALTFLEPVLKQHPDLLYVRNLRDEWQRLAETAVTPTNDESVSAQEIAEVE